MAEESPNMQKFELYIKASAIDKETKGADPICQQFFMITCLLGENQDDIDFKVFTVQADCPPKNFAAGWSKKYPVVMVNSGRNKSGQDISGMMYDTFEELELFFESINRECPELKRKNAPNQTAMKVIENLYKHFNHFIAGQPEKGLVAELRKLNEHLEGEDEYKFMVDNVLSFSDCHLLPRLQHIRVASKAYRDFDIPVEFNHVWSYLRDAYEQEAFKSTMPSDQDIIFFYEKKAKNPLKVSRKGGKPTLEKFTYTMDVPSECLKRLDNGDSHEPEVSEVAVAEEEPSVPDADTNGAAEVVQAEDEAANGLPTENGSGDSLEETSGVVEEESSTVVVEESSAVVVEEASGDVVQEASGDVVQEAPGDVLQEASGDAEEVGEKSLGATVEGSGDAVDGSVGKVEVSETSGE